MNKFLKIDKITAINIGLGLVESITRSGDDCQIRMASGWIHRWEEISIDRAIELLTREEEE